MSNESKPENFEDVPVASSASYTDWAKQVVENLVEAEKKWIELASEQNALVLKAIRQGVEFYRSAPNQTTANWARQGIESFMDAQKRWAETAQQQRAQLFQQAEQAVQNTQPGVEAVAEAPAHAAQNVSNLAQQQVEMLVDARKRWLDFAAQQNAQFLHGVRQALGVRETTPGAANFTDWAQQAMNNYVEVQKRWLDLATQFPFQRRSK